MKGKPYGQRTARKIAQWYKEREANAAGADAELALEKRKRSRLRLYECAECNDKTRKASDTWTGYHLHVDPETYAEHFFPYILKTVKLDTLPF